MQGKPVFTVIPSIGPVGTYFIVKGTHFQPHEEIVIYYKTPSGFERRFPPTYKSLEDGTVGIVPYDMSDPAVMEVGMWEVFGEGSQSGKSDKVSFEVVEKPLLTISPPIGSVGTCFIVKGIHFQPHEEVVLYYTLPSGTKRRFGPVVYMTDKNGTFTISPYWDDTTRRVFAYWETLMVKEPGIWELFGVGGQSGKTGTIYFQIEPSMQQPELPNKKDSKHVRDQNNSITKIKILFLGANPASTARLKLDEEVKSIQVSLKLAKERENLELKQEWALTSNSLMQAILDELPTVVHFSGHGEQEGIIVQNEHGELTTIAVEALANLFKLFKDSVKCVVLNACYSEEQAKAIKLYIPHVIGMKARISDKAAIAFSTGFYKAIGAGKDIPFAFEFGKTAIQLENISNDDIPILI